MFSEEISPLNVALFPKPVYSELPSPPELVPPIILVTWLVFQSGIEPYSLEEHSMGIRYERTPARTVSH